MENVNEILKRQLLLMKFDSGVTLKENYEKVSGKRVLKEGLAENVKNIVDGCYTRDNNTHRALRYDDSDLLDVAEYYNEAIKSAGGTDCEKLKLANDKVRDYFAYSDLCQMIFNYDGRYPGDGFYEDLDWDINVDDAICGWGEVEKAFNRAIQRTSELESKSQQQPAQQQQQQQQQPAPSPAPIANPESGDMYMKPGGLAHTFDFFKRTFPCVFAQNRVDTQEVYNNGSYDYILIVAPGGQVIQMYFDGFLREQRTLADVTYNGVPAKISCNGNKIKIVGR